MSGGSGSQGKPWTDSVGLMYETPQVRGSDKVDCFFLMKCFPFLLSSQPPSPQSYLFDLFWSYMGAQPLLYYLIKGILLEKQVFNLELKGFTIPYRDLSCFEWFVLALSKPQCIETWIFVLSVETISILFDSWGLRLAFSGTSIGKGNVKLFSFSMRQLSPSAHEKKELLLSSIALTIALSSR